MLSDEVLLLLSRNPSIVQALDDDHIRFFRAILEIVRKDMQLWHLFVVALEFRM